MSVVIRSLRTDSTIPYDTGSVSVQHRLGVCSQIRFSVTDGADLLVGEPFEVYLDEAETRRVVAGTIDRIDEEEILHTPTVTMRRKVRGICYTSLADRFIVNEIYTERTAGEIVRSLVGRYLALDNVSTNGVTDGPLVLEARFPRVRLSDALNDLADITGYYWYINANRDVTFAPRTENTAPVSITETNKPYRSLSVERGRKEYRNEQFVSAGQELTEERTETFVGDGERRTFNVAFPVGVEPEVLVNGEAQTVGILGLEALADWGWNKTRTEITQVNPAAAPLTEADTLTVRYRGLVPILVKAKDPDAIDERKAIEGGSGIYQDLDEARELDNRAAAFERAEGLLNRFGQVREEVQFETDETRLRRGQLLTIDLPSRGLQGDYLIESIRWRQREDNELRARVTAISGASVGGWTRYFRQQRQTRKKLTIREDETVVFLRTLEDGVSGTAAATTTEDTATAFIVGTSEVGYTRIGDVGHEDGPAAEEVAVSSIELIQTINPQLTIGVSDVAFSRIL